MLLVNILYIFYSSFRTYVANGFRYCSISVLKNSKGSDTLVILGAGSTLGELDDRKLDELSKFDIAGLSYSCVLPIRQTFYFYEGPSWHEMKLMTEHRDKIIPVLEKRFANGEIDNLIWKNSENKVFRDYASMDNFFTPIVSGFFAESSSAICRVLRYCELLRLSALVLLQKRGSVSSLVHFAGLLEYRRVIFAGVDLKDSEYFFVNNPKYAEYNFLDPYAVENTYDFKGLHRTNNPVYGMPVEEVLKAMIDCQSDIKFYVSSENSALAGFLPLYKF